ncbi:hypothetical protein [Salinicoccus halodurans]|uniref:DUF771 domain-containing protein n=1 Tax=Salinicoccus halodurans TaxID=407035 RepID=A0A0F7HMN3_9STAP|nr:hypothetical protein [Salinicoccus halodurans]AKG74398.1 hypothetical protein AAT16_09225 [Salinicoccus halodurans]SFK95443.1 hypothetical protein SAMN05216235_2744 [Salinicoccus halodurans]
MLIDEQAFKQLIHEAVKEALPQQAQREYQEYATINEFLEISGMKETWFRDNVLSHPDFKECVFRPGNKYYIHVSKGLAKLEHILRDLERGA